MPKFLIYGSYTKKGLKGFIKEGGKKRREATAQAAKSVGATLEAYYFAFGDNDFYTIFDAPNQAAAIASTINANATGAVKVKTVVLITPEEIDEAIGTQIDYRAPGK